MWTFFPSRPFLLLQAWHSKLTSEITPESLCGKNLAVFTLTWQKVRQVTVQLQNTSPSLGLVVLPFSYQHRDGPWGCVTGRTFLWSPAFTRTADCICCVISFALWPLWGLSAGGNGWKGDFHPHVLSPLLQAPVSPYFSVFSPATTVSIGRFPALQHHKKVKRLGCFLPQAALPEKLLWTH